MHTQPDLVIRTDAGRRVGIGHLMRCMTIALAWENRGGNAIFIMSPLPQNIEFFFDSHGFVKQYVHVEPGSIRDAEIVSEKVKECDASWLIADGYWFDSNFQQTVYSDKYGLMLIDALGAPQKNYAHILLNANHYANENYYALREPVTRLLLGLEYLPLRPEFSNFIPRDRDNPLPIHNVLICLGGSDPDNVSQLILELLLTSFPELHYTVIIGPGNENLDSLLKIEANYTKRIVLEHAPGNIPELMNNSDFAILAGGSTVWEAIYMGLPCILTSFADNQIRVCTALDHCGLALYSGHFNVNLPAKLIHDIKKLLSSDTLYTKISSTGKKLIDGKGATKIVDAMLSYSRVTNSDPRSAV